MCCSIEMIFDNLGLKDQGTGFEFTVVQKLNHGSFPKSGGNRFRGSFFVTFLEKQKSKDKTWKNDLKTSQCLIILIT